MDMTVRTLQRRLADHDLSYSCILDQSRFLKAEALLLDADIKLVDISLMLGYADAAGFTRAFRRWAGVSPREYRRECLDS
jgi:AraC-like DNA-binding protein